MVEIIRVMQSLSYGVEAQQALRVLLYPRVSQAFLSPPQGDDPVAQSCTQTQSL